RPPSALVLLFPCKLSGCLNRLPPGQRAYNPNDQHCTQESNNQRLKIKAANSVINAKELAGQKTADQSADNTQDNVTQDPKAATLHHQAGQPTSNQPYYDPGQNTH